MFWFNQLTFKRKLHYVQRQWIFNFPTNKYGQIEKLLIVISPSRIILHITNINSINNTIRYILSAYYFKYYVIPYFFFTFLPNLILKLHLQQYARENVYLNMGPVWPGGRSSVCAQ